MKHHPLYKRLSRYGTESDVIANINEEVSPKNAKIPKEGLVTKNWMIRRKLFTVEIERNYLNCKID